MNNLDAVIAAMSSATQFKQIFGAPENLRASFAALAQVVHPDHNETKDAVVAQRAFQDLQRFYKAARIAREEGVYDYTFSTPGQVLFPKGGRPNSSLTAIQSSRATYFMDAATSWSGDFSHIYKATVKETAQEVLVKIARSPKRNTLLKREADVLAQFAGSKEPKFKTISPYVPKLLDTFLAPGTDGKLFQANVTTRKMGMVSLTQVIKAHPMGLDPRDAAWIFRRILGQAMAAAAIKSVHCALTPDHVLVDPVTHDPLHIGWTHSIEDPQLNRNRVSIIIDRWDYMYPPEVMEKELPTEQTDIYMAGKLMIKLLGGDGITNNLPATVPFPVQQSILNCVEESYHNRPRSAKEAMEKFTSAIRSVWGKQYRPLTMPETP